MSLSVAQFLAPVGPLDAALLFPGEDSAAVDLRLNGYITRANQITVKLTTATPDQRDAVGYLFVVYRAYDSVVDRMANAPSSFSAVDEGSISFSSAQLSAMTKKRDAALDAYNDAVAELTASPVADRQPTMSVRTSQRF